MIDYQAFIEKLISGWTGDCPCCGRWTQVYRRTLHTSMAIQLAELYRAGGAWDYVHTSRLNREGSTGTGDFCKAKYWSLIQERPEAEVMGEKRSSGFWMLTTRGFDFLKRGGVIEKYALVYDDKVIGFRGPHVTFQDCLGKRFNYMELLEEKVA